MHTDSLRDFALRTRRNLELIEQVKAETGEGYEVTQLVNSLLGLIVMPREKYRRFVRRIPLDDLREQGWPVPRSHYGFEDVRTLPQLVRMLRNAVAHFNLRFHPDSEGEIDAVRLWNEWEGERTWEVTMSVRDLRRITELFVDLILQNEDIDRNRGTG